MMIRKPYRVSRRFALVFIVVTIAVAAVFIACSNPDEIIVGTCREGLTAVGRPQVCVRIQPGAEHQTELFVRHGQLLAKMDKTHPAYVYFDAPMPLTELVSVLLPLQATCERVIAYTKPLDIVSTIPFASIPCSNISDETLSALNGRLGVSDLNPESILITETSVQVNAVLVVAPAEVLLKFWQDRPDLVRVVSFSPTRDSNPLGFDFPARFEKGGQ